MEPSTVGKMESKEEVSVNLEKQLDQVQQDLKDQTREIYGIREWLTRLDERMSGHIERVNDKFQALDDKITDGLDRISKEMADQKKDIADQKKDIADQRIENRRFFTGILIAILAILLKTLNFF